MPEESFEGVLEDLRSVLDRDRSEIDPRYPDYAGFLLKDEAVRSAIASRLAAGRRLIAIKALPYDFLTGLNAAYFEFATDEPVALRRDTVLVLSNSYTRPVAIIDPFDPDHPNHVMPGIKETDLPLVLAAPSDADSRTISREEMQAAAKKTEAFLAQAGVMAAAAAEEAPGNGGGSGADSTSTGYCIVYSMPTLQCQPTGLIGMICTQVGGTPRRVLDTIADECQE
jgi:hypothetical protein